MPRLAHWVTTIAVLGWLGWIFVTYDAQLPAAVAQTFGENGAPVGFTSRESFWGIIAAVVVTVLMSFHVMGMVLRSRAAHPGLQRARGTTWPSDRNSATLQAFESWMILNGNALLAFVGWMVILVCRANIDRAPLEGFGLAIALIATLMLLSIGWAVWRFRGT